MSKINYNSKCGEFCCFKLLSYPFDFNVALLSVDGATLGLTIYLVLYFPKAFPNALDKKI